MIFECPGSQKFKKPYPEIITCAKCGGEAEVWSDEVSGICGACGAMVIRSAGQNCLDWCKYAAECIGKDKYEKYLKGIKEERGG